MAAAADSGMHETYDALAARAVERLRRMQPGSQLWIAIAGPPGAGKTTLSYAVRDRISQHVPCAVVPMDGYHFYRRELDAMEDPAAAHRRRGAHWTFNARKFVDDLRSARAAHAGFFPSFDHAVGDPIERDIEVTPEHKIVLVEGNYLLLYDVEPWNELRELFDEKWYIDCPEGTSRDRVYRRHLEVGSTPESAAFRLEDNDLPNARVIAETAKYADHVVATR